jgi:signal peptidase I
MSRGWLGRSIVAGVAVFVAVIGWAFLGPSRLGGGASYAVIAGSSMAPSLRAGDLAVLREAKEYSVGDIVGYRTEGGQVVVHRVVGRDGDRLSFKGDANSWTDSRQARQQDIVGELWIRAPGLGGVIAWIRSPAGLILLGLLIAAALALFMRTPGSKPAVAAPSHGEDASRPVTIFAGATIGFMLLGILSFTRPSSEVSSFTTPYRHEGRFSYSARSAASGVYEGSGASTGEPVFLRVVPSMDVRYSYRLDSQTPHTVGGTSRVVAEVSDASGWKRKIELLPQTGFEGGAVTTTATVHFGHVWDVIRRAEALTGVARGSYALTIVPEITVRGSVGGFPLEDRFAPRLGFRLDALQLTLDAPAGDPVALALSPAKEGSTRGTGTAERTIKLIGLSASIRATRGIAVGGMILSLAATAIAARRRARPRRRNGNEAEHIRADYGHMFLPVRTAGISAFKRVIDLEDVHVLAQIAERGGGIIFHEQRGGRHSYLVPEGDVAYRYAIEDDGAGDSADLHELPVQPVVEHPATMYRPARR